MLRAEGRAETESPYGWASDECATGWKTGSESGGSDAVAYMEFHRGRVDRRLERIVGVWEGRDREHPVRCLRTGRI